MVISAMVKFVESTNIITDIQLKRKVVSREIKGFLENCSCRIS